MPDLELAGVCLSLKEGEQLHLPALITLCLDGCIIHRSSSLRWNQVMTPEALPALTCLTCRPVINQALIQELDTSAKSLLALVGNLASLELCELHCWLGTNVAALWAAMIRLTRLAVVGSDLLIDLRLQLVLRHLPASLLRLNLGRLRLRRSLHVLEAVKEALVDGMPSVTELQVLTMPYMTPRATVSIKQLAVEVAAMARERGICVIEQTD